MVSPVVFFPENLAPLGLVGLLPSCKNPFQHDRVKQSSSCLPYERVAYLTKSGVRYLRNKKKSLVEKKTYLAGYLLCALQCEGGRCDNSA